MYRYLFLVLIFQIISCTDQGNVIEYSIVNTSNHNLSLVLFDRFGKNDTITINKTEGKVLDQDGPPYDSGPFAGKDSISVIFDDNRIVTYKSLNSKNDCINSEKNPFCEHSHYVCLNSNCTFEIDSIEYQKAK